MDKNLDVLHSLLTMEVVGFGLHEVSLCDECAKQLEGTSFPSERVKLIVQLFGDADEPYVQEWYADQLGYCEHCQHEKEETKMWFVEIEEV